MTAGTPQQALDDLLEVVKWIDREFSGVELLQNTEQLKIALGCFDLALEHLAAITMLFQSGLVGSAYALLRVLQEAVIRGLWFRHCATSADVKKFKRDEIDPNHGQMIKAIETAIGAEVTSLSRLKETSWKFFNDFTHTGFQHVLRRHAGGRLQANYDKQEQISALECAGALGLIAAGELAELTTPPKIDRVLETMRAYADRHRT